jgi:hypothetical protein
MAFMRTDFYFGTSFRECAIVDWFGMDSGSCVALENLSGRLELSRKIAKDSVGIGVLRRFIF